MRLADSKPNLAGSNLEKFGFNVAETNCCPSSELQTRRNLSSEGAPSIVLSGPHRAAEDAGRARISINPKAAEKTCELHRS